LPTHPRPLSPHLSIYRFTITMAMSIIHRATGLGLYAGTLLLAVWFIAGAFGDGALGVVHAVYGSWIGQIILFLATWALFQHLLSGLRHYLWDTGRGFSHAERFGLSRAAAIGGILLTLLAWAIFVWF
jgi:succinate dehydrogenase / fumarate reductase cytochrome b subunit